MSWKILVMVSPEELSRDELRDARRSAWLAGQALAIPAISNIMSLSSLVSRRAAILHSGKTDRII